MIKTIAVGVDFSETASQALSQASHVARHLHAEVVLVHVRPAAAGNETELARHDLELLAWRETQLRERQGELQAMRERLASEGIAVSTLVRQGNPPDALCAVVEEIGAELVVVGSHGYTGIKRFLLGSVAEAVVRRCEASVLVARPPGPELGFRRVLVPLEFDASTDSVIETALLLAREEAEIELFHCWHLPPGFAELWQNGPDSVVSDVRHARSEQVSAKLRALVLRHRRGGGKRIVFDQVESTTRDGIIRRLEMADYDLVVVGTHSRKGLKRWFAGSIAEATARHAPCSVMVTKGTP